MISHAEYSIILSKSECGSEVNKVLHVLKQTGSIVEFSNYYIVKCASEKDQDHWFAVFENRIDMDFPGDEDDDEYDDGQDIDVQMAKELADIEASKPPTESQESEK